MCYWWVWYKPHTFYIYLILYVNCESNYAMYFMCTALHNLYNYNIKILITRSILIWIQWELGMLSSQVWTQTHVSDLTFHTWTALHCLLQEIANCFILIQLTMTERMLCGWHCWCPFHLLSPSLFQLCYKMGITIPILQINQSFLSNHSFKG